MIVTYRPITVALAAALAVALAGCGDGNHGRATPTAAVSGTPAIIIATPATPIAKTTATVPATVTPIAPSATATERPPAGETGIDGSVTLGPMCPVERADSPCPDRPYAARITIWRDGTLVLETRSGDDGRFRALLPPGTYRVVGESESALPRGSEETVTVDEGRLTPVQIRFDSGIR
jgi:hypothetical protein